MHASRQYPETKGHDARHRVHASRQYPESKGHDATRCDTMHVMEPNDATEVYGTFVHPEPRLLQPPRARIMELMELLRNLYKYKNLFRC
jgi:hypothetical protein